LFRCGDNDNWELFNNELALLMSRESATVVEAVRMPLNQSAHEWGSERVELAVSVPVARPPAVGSGAFGDVAFEQPAQRAINVGAPRGRLAFEFAAQLLTKY
jgi:hypothetical protein